MLRLKESISHRFLRLWLGLALVSAAVSFGWLRADPADQYFYQGSVAQYHGNFDAAIPNWNAVLKLNPNDLAAFKYRGTAYLYKDDWNHSIADYSQVIQRKPNDVAAFDGRGYAHYEKQDWEEAINDFKSAIRLNSQNWALYRNLGRVYLTMDEFDNAITNFTTAIRLNPWDDWSYNCRAVAQEDKGNLTAAIADFKTALQISPNYANVYVNCGNLFRYEKQSLDVAIADYTEAIRLEPTNADTLAIRADAYFAQKKYDQALGDYNTAIQMQPTNAAYYFLRGQFQEWMTNYDGAADDFGEAVHLTPTNCGYWCVQGEFFEKMTNYEGAIAAFTQCIARQPTNGGYYAIRAGAEDVVATGLGKLGNGGRKKMEMDQAENDWFQACAEDAHYLNSLGRFECRQGLYAAAIDDFTEYIQAYPTNVNGWDSRALAYEEMANDEARHGELGAKNSSLDKALVDWNHVVLLQPGLLFLRGDFYARNNEFPEALADYLQNIQLRPASPEALSALAWFRATCPDKMYRNGTEATTEARKAIELLQVQSGYTLGALAAACAETGDFAQAIQHQNEALAAGDFSEGFRVDMAHRLALYEKHKPCHKILGLVVFEQ
jgi:tetratricopeptide (TPR) repeat protein